MNNEPICLDYETIEVLPDGSTRASTEFYRHNFRVSSCAFTERDSASNQLRSWYVAGEPAIREELIKIGKRPVIVHNVQFEMGVTRCRFPDVELNWYVDTMRMAQNWDNGGDENSFEILLIESEDEDGEDDAKKISTSGFGLVKCAKRILGAEDHKKEAYEWIQANVPECKKGKEGSFLDRLPEDIMARYNVADTETTYKLYEYLETAFLEKDFNWRFDHELYLSSAYHVVSNKIRGVLVDRAGVRAYAETVLKEIDEIGKQFEIRFADAIKVVERQRLLEEVRARKTLKGRKKYLKRVKSDPEKWADDIAFNVGSNKQLEALFVDVLKIEPKFFTEKGSPAFKSAMLSQWGEGGLMLGARRKRMLVLKQACNLYKMSEYDSRWHCDLRLAATATGRGAGGN